jgi:hypothetical protein
MNEALQAAIKKLQLSGMSQTLEVRLQEAASNRLRPRGVPGTGAPGRAGRAGRPPGRPPGQGSHVPRTKDPGGLRLAVQPSIRKKQVYELATCQFIHQPKDVLLLGSPGTGKSHPARAIGYQAIKASLLVLYRSIFDVVRDFPCTMRPLRARTKC